MEQTSTAKLPGFFQIFQSTLHIPRFNKTKRASGNAFIVNRLALGGKKESKYVERTLLWSSMWSVDLSLKG